MYVCTYIHTYTLYISWLHNFEKWTTGCGRRHKNAKYTMKDVIAHTVFHCYTKFMAYR